MFNRGFRTITRLVMGGLLLLACSTTALAVDAVVAQSYRADQQLQAGSLVSRKADDAEKVVMADSTNRSGLAGVVVERGDSFVSYNSAESSVQVASGGVLPLRVSTVNGDIKAGDQLTSSPVSGFAMRSTSAGKVIGRALDNFNSKTNGAQIRSVTDVDGRQTEVAIGQVSASIEISDWSGGGGTNAVIDNLQSLTSQVSGKQVSPANAILAALVLGIAVLISGIVLFSSVTSSIKSLGRNPLSHTVIRRSLAQVILIVIALLTTSIIVAYLIIGK